MASLEDFRSHEFYDIKTYFSLGVRVLEIGGGNGFQASMLKAIGADVKSIDIAGPSSQFSFFPVEIYDGKTIPFLDASFDMVFSSNVLEHVRDLNEMMAEIHRVLRPGGRAIHVLPTPAWRFWTSLAHYVYLAKRIFFPRHSTVGKGVSSVRARMLRSGLWGTLKRILIDGPHGEYPSAVSELWYYRKARWLDVFRRNGFGVVCSMPSEIFYTGYTIAPMLSMSVRRKLAKLFGSSTRIYVLQKI